MHGFPAALTLSVVLVGLAACARPVTVDRQALRATIGDAPVVMLSASWCGYCKKLRADLRQWDVAFSEFDVEDDGAGTRAYSLLRGHGVPILLVGEHRLSGYAPARARELLTEAGLLPSGAIH
jgi:glutaredoxin